MIIDLKMSNAERVKMSVEHGQNLARFGEYFQALRALFHASVERKVTLTEAMAKVWELPDSMRTLERSNYSLKLLMLMQEVQRLSGLVKSKDVKLQTTSGLVDEASRLREEFVTLQVKKNRFTAENKVVLPLGPKVSELKKPLVP